MLPGLPWVICQNISNPDGVSSNGGSRFNPCRADGFYGTLFPSVEFKTARGYARPTFRVPDNSEEKSRVPATGRTLHLPTMTPLCEPALGQPSIYIGSPKVVPVPRTQKRKRNLFRQGMLFSVDRPGLIGVGHRHRD